MTSPRNEMSTFTDWLGGARRNIQEKERAVSNLELLADNAATAKDFVSDVIAHQV